MYFLKTAADDTVDAITEAAATTVPAEGGTTTSGDGLVTEDGVEPVEIEEEAQPGEAAETGGAIQPGDEAPEAPVKDDGVTTEDSVG